jgi:pimeloyl-ACP methyl ester carboxylesterase
MLENANHEFLNVNNIKIHAVSMGNQTDKSPILLLHGFPEFYYSYRYVMPLLAKERKVIAIDQRGYNESDRPKGVKNYRLELLMSDVVEVIKQKSPTNKVILVGHDWGGAISWHVARYYPDFIEKLVILNCPPADLLFKAIRKIPRQLLLSYYVLLFQLPIIPEKLLQVKNFALLRRLLNSINIGDKKMQDDEIKEYIKCFNRPRGLSGINYYRAAFRDAILGRAQPPQNLKVKCPTLVLWGTKDLALHVSLTHFFPEYVEGKKLKIKYFQGIGHFIQQEIPAKVANEILKFI